MADYGICNHCGQKISLLPGTDLCIGCQRSQALGFFKRTNMPLLSKQKQELLGVIDHYEEMVNVSDEEVREVNEAALDALNGLLNFFDAFQDCAVDKLGFDEAEVFPGLEQDPPRGQTEKLIIIDEVSFDHVSLNSDGMGVGGKIIKKHEEDS